MLDGVSLDQMRAFIAAADEGSFSAAARKLRRAQSVVSALVSGLEGQIGVNLFDRSGRYPVLTAEGRALLSDARVIASGVESLKARAKGMAAGLEPELSVVIDVLFPIAVIAEAAKEFRVRFPATPLRLFVETLGGAFQPVQEGAASLSITANLQLQPSGFSFERLTGVAMTMVTGREHPLAKIKGEIPKSELARHVQLVLADRSSLSRGREYGVLSPLTWRLADLYAKHAFLLAGLGFGGMPRHAVAEDLKAGRLIELRVEDMPKNNMVLAMAAVWRDAAPPGPAGRWLIERLKQCEGKLG